MHSLGLAINAPKAPAVLVLDIKANYNGIIIVGIRERDGSIYVAQQQLVKDLDDRLKIPLDSLRLSDRTVDENGRLDFQDIAVVFADPHVGPAARRRGETITQLDNIQLK